MGFFKRFLERGWVALVLASPCVCAQDIEAPTLTAYLHVVDGYARVDRSAERSKLALGKYAQEFEQCGLSPATVRNQLFDILDGIMGAQGPLVEAIPLAFANKNKDDIRKTVRDYSAQWDLPNVVSWEVFDEHYSPWLQSVNKSAKPPLPLNTLGEWYEKILRSTELADTPLIALHGADAADDFNASVMVFSVARLGSASSLRLDFSMNASNWDEMGPPLQQVLEKKFSCMLWQRKEIGPVVRRALEVRGYQATELDSPQNGAQVAVLDTPTAPGVVQFFVNRPSYLDLQSGGVVVSPVTPLRQLQIKLDPEVRWDDVKHVLYLLSSDTESRLVNSRPLDYLCKQPATATSPAEVQWLENPKRDIPLSLFQRPMTPALTNWYRQLMQSLQFKFDVISADLASISARDDNVSDTRGTIPDLPSCGGEELNKKQGPAAPSGTSDPVAKDIHEANKVLHYRNSIALRVNKDPGNSIKPSVALTHTSPGNDNIWNIELGQQDRTTGKMDYARDFVAFDTLGRRLRLSAGLFSNYDKSRPVLANGTADERRSGGQIRASLDLWNEPARKSFGRVELGYTHSSVQYPGTPLAGENLSVVDLGVNASGGSPDAWRNQRWETAAKISLGKPSGNSSNYGKIELDGRHMQMLGLDKHISLYGKAAAISSNAPRSEWPTFGGSDSVRGYRSQAAAARQTWSVQNELWLPVDGLLKKTPDFAAKLRPSTALAVFLDGGGLSQQTPSPGMRWGAGIGLRISLDSNVLLQLDWARPLGRELATSPRENRFYFTLLAFRLP